MHLVNILVCEKSTLFKEGTTFHSEVLIIIETRKRNYNNTGTECKNHCVSSVGRGVE